MKEKWKENFEKYGVIGPFKVYEEEEAKEILKQIRIKNMDMSTRVFDNDVNYDRHFDIEELTRHVAHPRILEKLRAILGTDLLCWRSEFFPKFPGATGTEWHQVADYRYATGTPLLMPTEDTPSETLDITVWTAFTEATVENGCMKFLPGSHKKLYYDESKKTEAGRKEKYSSQEADTGFFGYNFQDFKIDPEWNPDDGDVLTMEMKPGECVIFTARCVHASYPNISKRSTRFAISSRYTQPHVRVYPGHKNFNAHGSAFDLSRYGTVLVSGEDKFGHNVIKSENLRGMRFPHWDDFEVEKCEN